MSNAYLKHYTINSENTHRLHAQELTMLPRQGCTMRGKTIIVLEFLYHIYKIRNGKVGQVTVDFAKCIFIRSQ